MKGQIITNMLINNYIAIFNMFFFIFNQILIKFYYRTSSLFTITYYFKPKGLFSEK